MYHVPRRSKTNTCAHYLQAVDCEQSLVELMHSFLFCITSWMWWMCCHHMQRRNMFSVAFLHMEYDYEKQGVPLCMRQIYFEKIPL
jgi:hypothetical protein